MALAAVASMLACSPSPDPRSAPPDPELLHTALRELTDVMVYDIFNPPLASRVYAYASIAAYEALQHGDPAYPSLAGRLNGLEAVPAPEPDAEPYLPLAGVHAFLTVGRTLVFTRERVDSAHFALVDRVRRTGLSTAAIRASLEYGDRVARHILDWVAEDYYRQTRGYPKFTVVSSPGRWIPTPPGYMDALEPYWARLRPFVLDSAGQFRPEPPHAFDMSEGSGFHREVMEVYRVTQQLTDEQREIAEFWDDNPYVMHVRGHAMFATKKLTPGGHWMNIATIAARAAGASLLESAYAYARTAVALADGFISCWEEKYRTNLVRPETVINAYLDDGWQPVLQTPPFPEYTSGHSVISTAAAMVLTDQFGEDFAFVDDSGAGYGLTVRRFDSFEEAAAEAAISRLYGGIHYPMAIEAGVRQGRQVGELVVQRLAARPGGAGKP